jgi:D-beta-D-heptose 7-phosphate kinase/D-beta-D-heptose 1-phosphate adenosyltransferase
LLKEKIKPLSALCRCLSREKIRGKKIVFTNGCFDLLHLGHARYLEEAKRKGDVLVVAVNSDASVRRLKGAGRPIVNERDRAGLIASLQSVDYVVIFREDTPLKVISALTPDVLVKGADWKKKDIVGADIVKAGAGRVVTIPLVKGRSSSNLIRKIAKKGPARH